MRWNSAGHQLDGQRHPIQLATDIAYDLRISVTEVRGVTCGYGTLHEEPCGRVRDEFGFASKGLRWNLKRGKFEHELACHLKGFTACCQYGDTRGVLVDLLGEACGRLHNVLAVVEHQQKLPVT